MHTCPSCGFACDCDGDDLDHDDYPNCVCTCDEITEQFADEYDDDEE